MSRAYTYAYNNILVYEYIECAGKLPPIAYDVENKLIELFTTFNSQTCQLVLGAGAMQRVNLKAITAKHLALAQQSISVLFCSPLLLD